MINKKKPLEENSISVLFIDWKIKSIMKSGILLLVLFKIMTPVYAQVEEKDLEAIEKYVSMFYWHNTEFPKNINVRKSLLILARTGFRESPIKKSSEFSTEIPTEYLKYLVRVGTSYLTGDGVPQDMERAALFLGGAYYHANPMQEYKENRINVIMPERIMQGLAYSAHKTAIKYLRLKPTKTNKEISEGFLSLSTDAGSQPATLMYAYIMRMKQMDENLDSPSRYVANTHEIKYFKRASECTSENMSQKITPWDKGICAEAAMEFKIAKSVEQERLEDFRVALNKDTAERKLRLARNQEPNWALIAAAGIVALYVSNVGKGTSSAMSDAEWAEEQQRRADRQMESTWGHAGAAMFLP